MSSSSRVQFLGLGFDALSLPETIDAVIERAQRPGFSYVVTPNVDHVVRLERGGAIGEAFAAAYRDASLVLCDSRVLARLARLSGVRLSLVPGSDLTPALLADPRMADRSVAVIGGSPSLLPALTRRYPAIAFAQHRPPMGVLGDDGAMTAIEAFVAAADADVAIFAIGTPQSEIVAQRCRERGQARGVGLCVGASLEFIVGEKRRAPPWMQRLGIEWAFRLGSEPRRLWRRYLVDGPRVFAIWMRRGRR